MITILYFIWIAYTVTSLSVILGLVFLSILAKAEKKKNDLRIREMLTKRPTDSE
jgi:heme exporter protein D